MLFQSFQEKYTLNVLIWIAILKISADSFMQNLKNSFQMNKISVFPLTRAQKISN